MLIVFMNKTTILNKHLEFKKTSVHTSEKIKDIKRYLEKFLNFTSKPLNKFNEDDLAKFLNSLEFSTRTQNDIKTYIKVFIKWNFADWSSRFRNLDRLCKMQRPSKAYKPEQMLQIEDIEKLVKGEQDLMYKVYWLVFFYGGFRPSEACNLKWSQIDFDKGVIIKVHTSKTNRDFYKSLPREVEHLLKEWKKFNSSEWVFPSPIKKDCSIKSRSICCRLKKLSKRTLGQEVVPYALRHSIATILYKDDRRKDDDTANQLGHNKSMKATYMNLDEDTLKSKARSLWIKTKPLAKEEKEELNEKIKQHEEKINSLLKFEDKAFTISRQNSKIVKLLMKTLQKSKDSSNTKLLKELKQIYAEE